MYYIPVLDETLEVNCRLQQTIAEPPRRTSAMQHYWFALEERLYREEERLYREKTASLSSVRPEFHPDFVKQDQEGSLLAYSPAYRHLIIERSYFPAHTNST